MIMIIAPRERMIEDGRRHPLQKDQGKSMGGSPEPPCQFLEGDLALFAGDNLFV